MEVIRQGDVLLVPIARAGDGLTRKNGRAVRREEPGIVLAHGEATGHHHHVKSRHAQMRSYGRGASARRILFVHKSGAKLEHQEHTAIDLAPGKYEVRRQTEYAPPAAERSVTTRRSFEQRSYVYD